jgi:signal transduction histidine kinase
MGLAMAYGTAINHGGWLQVDTELDVGTTFYMFLPKLDEELLSGNSL